MTLLANIMLGLLVILVGPFGHMLGRAIYFNGSLDKWWLSLIPIFWIPPFSIVTYILMLMGFVKMGQGASPLDLNLLGIFLGTLITPMVFDGFGLNGGFIGSFAETLIMLLIVLAFMYLREVTNCANVKESASLSRSMFNASISYTVGILFKIVLSVIIDYTPIGFGLNLMQDIIPGIETFKEALLYSFGVSTAVMGTNMVQATDLQGYCATDKPLWAALLVSGIGVIANTSFEFYKNYKKSKSWSHKLLSNDGYAGDEYDDDDYDD